VILKGMLISQRVADLSLCPVGIPEQIENSKSWRTRPISEERPLADLQGPLERFDNCPDDH
jgi:hypothetical protein